MGFSIERVVLWVMVLAVGRSQIHQSRFAQTHPHIPRDAGQQPVGGGCLHSAVNVWVANDELGVLWCRPALFLQKLRLCCVMFDWVEEVRTLFRLRSHTKVWLTVRCVFVVCV